MATLESLMEEEKKLRGTLTENKEKQHEFRKDIWIKDNGINIGDEVVLKNGDTGVLEKLNASYSYVRPIVRMYKKDGTLGKRERQVYTFDEMKKK